MTTTPATSVAPQRLVDPFSAARRLTVWQNDAAEDIGERDAETQSRSSRRIGSASPCLEPISSRIQALLCGTGTVEFTTGGP